jgi:hypothetical protein
MLRDGTFYRDLGANHFHRTSPAAQTTRLVRQIEKLGFSCAFICTNQGGFCLATAPSAWELPRLSTLRTPLSARSVRLLCGSLAPQIWGIGRACCVHSF